MALYETNDGERIQAECAGDVLAYLHQSARLGESSYKVFLEELVTRVEQQTGLVIKSDEEEAILEGLIKVGLIKLIGE